MERRDSSRSPLQRGGVQLTGLVRLGRWSGDRSPLVVASGVDLLFLLVSPKGFEPLTY